MLVVDVCGSPGGELRLGDGKPIGSGGVRVAREDRQSAAAVLKGRCNCYNFTDPIKFT